MDKLIAENPSTKRMLLGVLAGAVVSLNHKFGLGLDTTDVTALVGLAAVMITGSNWKEAKVAGAEAAAKVASVPDAIAVITTPAKEVP